MIKQAVPLGKSENPLAGTDTVTSVIFKLPKKIAELREEHHLRQIDLAKKLGVSRQFISQIETGQERNLTLETLIKIAKSLGRGVKISFPKVSTEGPYLKVA